MAGGPLLPSSIYVGGASGNLTLNYYIGTTATGTGAVAGWGRCRRTAGSSRGLGHRACHRDPG